MAVTLTVLASGSRGNCALLASSRTRMLVDAGLSSRETLRRLRTVGEDLSAISGIVITHEHSDHISGLWGLARKLKIPVFMTGATHHEWMRWARNKYDGRAVLSCYEEFRSGHGFCIGDISVQPFTIPHDACDPVGFTFRADGVKIGVVTDLGYMPSSVSHHIRGCDVLVMESNHDLEMLRVGPYPWSVKQRVMSRVGHLSNDALAQFLTGDYDGNAAFLVLAHLSEQNNDPGVALRSAEKALGPKRSLLHNRLLLASQSQPLEPIRL